MNLILDLLYMKWHTQLEIHKQKAINADIEPVGKYHG